MLTKGLGFLVSFTIFYGINTVFPPPLAGTFDEYDYYGTFTEAEARRIGVSTEATQAVKIEKEATA